MNQSKISVRYAKALFQLAVEKNSIDKVKKDIIALADLSSNNIQFIRLLESPVVKTTKKQEISHKIFKGSVEDLTLSFLDLLFKNNRETYLNDICRNFLDQLRAFNNVKSGIFVTAYEISPEVKKDVHKIAEEYFKTNIELNTEVDENLIGGYILRVGDNQLDASISSNLNKIRRKLIKTDFDIKF